MDIQVQARMIFGFLSVFLFTATLLHLFFPHWKIFRNKHAREFLGDTEGMIYEKKSAVTLSILGLFTAFAAASPIYFRGKSLMLFTYIGLFLSLFYQSCLNHRYFGTLGGPHMLHKKKYLWLRMILYVIVLMILFTLLMSRQEISLFAKCLIIALVAGGGSRFING